VSLVIKPRFGWAYIEMKAALVSVAVLGLGWLNSCPRRRRGRFDCLLAQPEDVSATSESAFSTNGGLLGWRSCERAGK